MTPRTQPAGIEPVASDFSRHSQLIPTSMASLLTERCYRSTPRGVLTAHAWWLCQCETGACQYHWCSIYRGLERVGSWVPGGSVGRDQLAMAAKVRRHWFNLCRLGFTWVPIFLYSSILTSLRKENHLDISNYMLFHAIWV